MTEEPDLDFGLKGKVAVVTGAGSRASGVGNGRAAAVLLAAAGARVALVDSVAGHMEETRQLIEARGGTCIAIDGDVSDAAQAERCIQRVMDAWDRLDVLVNNVGIAGPAGSVVDVDINAWNDCLRINVNSMMLMSRFAIPHMRRLGEGSIVNVSSTAGLRGGHPVAYSTTKSAVLNFTRSMAATHGPEGIRVNAVAPGFVHTPMVYAQGLAETDRERRMRAAPLRTEGTGWDVGKAILFLAGSHARWITGVTLPVDAGLTAVVAMEQSMTVTSEKV
ncbi:SDR family oxidoreductase [Dactylosporangium sp. AC04546]|uniref:SDR family NAD(P)-dependent oxidoreductase n=1 Tax=Dactylosporangium sp. AC04546 TaxID=2862460 RepID=UPI001EDD56B2|nr:SDR family oxidoreductase [Dactylosporangium sp. AC04546]WVK86588.1 SDR family oxidoreductase [Dactylosporangium sp. AC04546]